jgi:hypothetical protein
MLRELRTVINAPKSGDSNERENEVSVQLTIVEKFHKRAVWLWSYLAANKCATGNSNVSKDGRECVCVWVCVCDEGHLIEL